MSDLQEVLVTLARIEGRVNAVEAARALARLEQDEWRDEVRGELRDIKNLARATNGRVGELEKWRERAAGFAAAFRWWPGAVAGVIAGCVIALVAHFT